MKYKEHSLSGGSQQWMNESQRGAAGLSGMRAELAQCMKMEIAGIPPSSGSRPWSDRQQHCMDKCCLLTHLNGTTSLELLNPLSVLSSVITHKASETKHAASLVLTLLVSGFYSNSHIPLDLTQVMMQMQIKALLCYLLRFNIQTTNNIAHVIFCLLSIFAISTYLSESCAISSTDDSQSRQFRWWPRPPPPQWKTMGSFVHFTENIHLYWL